MRGPILLAALGGLVVGVARANERPSADGNPRQSYLLGCGGCHGIDGVSNGAVVPTLKGLVGYYLSIPEGRAYLVRLPNVAFANLDDTSLAEMLNYVVFDIGGGSAPARATKFDASEVGMLRKHPLTEVSLVKVRETLVNVLTKEHHAPPALREYSEQLYIR